jgi:hypothetical protein
MKTFIKIAIFSFLAVYQVNLYAQTLAGTDDLGRVLLQNDAVGNPKTDKCIALFYFLWQGDKGSVVSPRVWDLDEIAKKHPEVLENGNDPNWGGLRGSFYFWGQPIYGYYKGDDYWVQLRSIQLLTDAGVDLLVIDATNRLTYPEQSEALMKAMDAVRAQGKNPPKIAYYTNTLSGETMQEIYNFYYKKDAPHYHPACWFYLDGKPLIIGITKEAEGKDYQSFFTFREAQWPTVSQVTNGWPWISFKRKPEVHFNDRGEKEIINVSVAQHPNPGAGMGGSAFYGNKDNWGRSYHKGSPGNPDVDIAYGYNIQEQWEDALKANTKFIYITGWNEWVAGRWDSHDDNPEHSWFCDAASPEFSRDIEPSLTTGLKDHYYMQMVNNIRRFKGLEKISTAGVQSIQKWSDWAKVTLSYFDYTGDTQQRNHPGAQSEPIVIYTNQTGRNDFRLLKTAHDKKNLYFYAETVQDITPMESDNWMRLYIDSDRNFQTGWKGYDYRVIKGNTLQHFVNGEWKSVQSVTSLVSENKLMITVPRKQVNILRDAFNLEFKWSDNMQTEDPLDWYVNGDTAPGGRFNYVYATR